MVVIIALNFKIKEMDPKIYDKTQFAD